MGEKRLTSHSFEGLPPWLKKSVDNAVLNDVHNAAVWQPQVINMAVPEAEQLLKKMIDTENIVKAVDIYDEQLAELFISDNAQLYKAPMPIKQQAIKEYLHDYHQEKDSWQKGGWIYYPWSGCLVHMLNEADFTKLRTIRNQFIITATEQAQYAAYNVGCAGMSVGSNGAAAIAITGGSSQLKIADGAVFSGSNLNRVRTGVDSVGLPKTVIVAREIYEMNPYMHLNVTGTNLSQDNIASFFDEPWKLNCVVDEIDDVITKIRLRIEARKRGIPVIMVTEPGDTIVLDVERYDLDKNLPLFHGLINNPEAIADAGVFKNERERIKSIVTIIGVKNLPIRDQEAAVKVGSVIPSAPQLGSTAMVAGGVIAYAIRQLATGAPIKSGRKRVDLNSLFWQPQDYLRYRLNHQKSSRNLSRIVSNM